MISINNSEHWLIQQSVLQAKKAAVKSNDVNLTYNELYELCTTTAVFLQSNGIQKEHNVGVFFEHNYELFVVVNALWLIGAVPVPLNTRNSIKEIEAQLKQADIKFLILSESFSENFGEISSESKRMVLPSVFQTDTISQGKNIQYSSFNILHSSLILFTSGSSGKPKAVVHTFKSLYESVKAIDEFSNLSKNDLWISSLPLYHIGGFMILVRALITGSCVVFPQSLIYDNIADTIIKFNPSHVSLVSTNLKRFLDDNIQPPKSLKQVYLGGGPLESELCIEAVNKGWPIIKVYGSTETCSMVAALTVDELKLKPDAVGKAIGKNKIRIGNTENEQEYEQDQDKKLGIGEIAVQGDSLFKEYYNDELSTITKLKDGFYFTGDFGRLDDEGNLYVESRREDLVITGGENVSTKEVETIIKSFDKVTDVCVFGIPDKIWGQKLCAAVVADKTVEPELRIFLKDNIAAYKVPKEIFFISEIPKSEMGKVNRHLLFELLNLG